MNTKSRNEKQEANNRETLTCLSSGRDKFDKEKNLIASLPVMRPSPSAEKSQYSQKGKNENNFRTKNQQ